MSERKTKKLNLYYDERLSCAQRFAFSLMNSNTQFRAKNSLNVGLKQ